MTETNPDPDRDARRAIIVKYCRMQTGKNAGVPKFCYPTKAEVRVAGQKGHPAQRRAPIIFDTEKQATKCAEELFWLDGIRMTVYRCHRSTRGHAHLSGK